VSGYTGELTRHPLDKLRVVSGGFPNLASWDKPGNKAETQGSGETCYSPSLK